MSAVDYAVVIFFMLGLLGLGAFLSRFAGRSSEDYILGGRKMPWWLAGTSLAATGLNASTMLNDSRKVRQDGLSGLWFSWGQVVGALFRAVWFDRLWRRAGFTTQMEFYHARYVGRAATFCRMFDSLLYGVFIAAVWAAVGLVGMKKIASILLGLPAEFALWGMTFSTDTLIVVVLVVVTFLYSAAAGVYGVVWTDLVEFIISLVASGILMFFVYRQVGWNVGLHERLVAHQGQSGVNLLSLVPPALPVLFYFLFVQPLFSLGGYGPGVQRYLCVKDEREVLYTAVYNAFLNFVIKPWPFYICGLCGMFLISDGFLLSQYPSISGPDGVMVPDYQRVFPLLAQQFLPAGLLGLMVTGFLTAFMSSFDTNIHNSTSIVINDIYRPYVANGKSDRHYVRASRVYMALITLVSSIIGIVSQDILKLTMFALAVSLAPGLIKLLRFVWWRVTGRAEAVTQCFSLGLTLVFTSSWGTDLVNQIVIRFFQQGNDIFYITRQVLLMGVSTVVSLIVIFFSRAEPMSHLCSFYGRVRPFGWWGPVRRECANNVGKPDSVGLMLLVSVCGIVLLLCSIFVMTGLLLALWKLCWISLLGVLPSALGLGWGVRKLYPAGTGG